MVGRGSPSKALIFHRRILSSSIEFTMTESELTGKLPQDAQDFLAWKAVKPAQPKKTGVVFMGGFNSDMSGSKASALAQWAGNAKRNFLRFDYFGHGVSSGRFVDGTIGRWRNDSLAVLDQLTMGDQVLVGSSMGGWMALLAALARPERVKGLVLIAPAPDFTEALMWAGFSEAIKEQLLKEGIYFEPSEYGDPYPISLNLIEEGRKHLLLQSSIALNIRVRILQGMQDPDVPHAHAMRLFNALATEDVTLTLIKSGDHRLSSPADLDRLIRELDSLLIQIEA
jgi:pimeloyl-ACP methyl ester carboxylesterase